MATITSNLDLVKPDVTDNIDVGVINSNYDKIARGNAELWDALSYKADATELARLIGMLGLYQEDVLGVCIDYENNTVTRLAESIGLTPGASFNKYPMFGGRKRCNVLNDGTISAFYGDSNYTESGHNGQVMVYQPKFYYMVSPIKMERQATGVGYILRRANYFITSNSNLGFKLHPAFYDENGKELDYILIGAYDGSIYDVSASEGAPYTLTAYLSNDEQIMDADADMLCSVAGRKTSSGNGQSLTRANMEKIANNRGAGWHLESIKALSMNQLLMTIEMGAMDMQAAVGLGVVYAPDDGGNNCAANTGATASLGNNTGVASSTSYNIGGTGTVLHGAGQVAVTYRGMENPWGNMCRFVSGVNIWGNGTMAGGQPYICTDYGYAERENNGNYVGAGFTLSPYQGIISAMGYSSACDWLFMPAETEGSPLIGDIAYITESLDGYRIAVCSGSWSYAETAGVYAWILSVGDDVTSRDVGGRLMYVPKAKD